MGRRAGFTLVEVLVALALVGVAVTMFSALLSAFADTRAARRQADGTAFARTFLDLLGALWRDGDGTCRAFRTFARPALSLPAGFASGELRVDAVGEEGGQDAVFDLTAPAPVSGPPEDRVSRLRRATVVLRGEDGRSVVLSVLVARPCAGEGP